MTRLLLERGLPRSAVKILQNPGWNVIHTFDSGLSHSTDHELLKIGALFCGRLDKKCDVRRDATRGLVFDLGNHHVEMEDFHIAEGILEPDAGALDAISDVTAKESPNMKTLLPLPYSDPTSPPLLYS